MFCCVHEFSFLFLERQRTLRSLGAIIEHLGCFSRCSDGPDEEVFASLSAVAPRSGCAVHFKFLNEQQFVDCGDVVSEVSNDTNEVLRSVFCDVGSNM